MARVELFPLIKSMSGTISKKKLADGTTVSYVVTKKGRLYIHTTEGTGASIEIRYGLLRFCFVATNQVGTDRPVRTETGICRIGRYI